MIQFEEEYFIRTSFTKEEVKNYKSSALRDIKIAEESNISEVKFQFSYNALIKLGIALIASQGYRIRSKLGHHVKIIEKISEISKDEDALIYGNRMRRIRNAELYEGDEEVTQKQAQGYLDFCKKIFEKAEKII